MTPRKQVIAIAAILVLAAVVDFLQRVHVPRAPTTRDSQIGSPTLPAVPLSLAMARHRLQSWLPAQTTGSQAQSESEQNESGTSNASIPDRANIGGWNFVLRGVFDAGPTFAVLDVMPISGGAVEQHRLAVGESLKGVRLEQISGRNISLSDGEKEIQLALFIDPKNNIASVDKE
jgi:hypothetical protein